MTFERIEALLRAAAGRGFAALEFSEGNAALRVVFGQASTGVGQGPEVPTARTEPSAGATPARRDAEPHAIIAPCVGFLRLRHPSGSALPTPGDAVSAGSLVGFVQAGPLLHPVAAPRAGVLGPALAADGAGVGYGAPLFSLS